MHAHGHPPCNKSSILQHNHYEGPDGSGWGGTRAVPPPLVFIFPSFEISASFTCQNEKDVGSNPGGKSPFRGAVPQF